MKIAVIGAGIVGITSAYELARDGHELEVYEASGAAAQGASFAPTGLMACSLPLDFSHPACPQGRGLGRLFAALTASPTNHRYLPHLRWILQWKAHQDEDTRRARLGQATALIRASQQRLQDICQHEGIEFERSTGHLLVFRTEAQAEKMQAKLAMLKDLNIPFRTLSAQEVRALEPALADDMPLAQAVFFPEDEAGNSRQFALALRTKSQGLGVQYLFDMPVDIQISASVPTLRLHSTSETRRFDHIVVCTGSVPTSVGACVPHANAAPVTGYSFSARIKEPLNAPRHSIHDAQTGTTLVRTGDRVRVSGGFELGGNPAIKQQKPLKLLYDALLQSFPGAATLSAGTQTWKGSIWVSKDGLPYVGPTQCPGLWLNVAHGPLGWAMACGSARLIADAIGQKDSTLDGAPYSPVRA